MSATDRSEEQRVKLAELREALDTDDGRKAASQLFQGEKTASEVRRTDMSAIVPAIHVQHSQSG